MPYEWTADAPMVSPEAGLEQAYRAAIVAATESLERAHAAGEAPEFSGGHFASPVNAAAKKVQSELDAALAKAGFGWGELGGRRRLQVVTAAVRSGFYVRSHGGGAKGWEALMAMARGTVPQPAPRAPAPTATGPA